jgi:hypothetical protein
MMIRNMTNIALAVAVFALAAPVAHSQNRVYNGATGRYTPNSTSGMYNQVNANNGYFGNNYAGYLFGANPYLFNANSVYSLGGALVFGSNGQLYNPFLNNGSLEPTYNVDGVTVPAPIGPGGVQQNPIQMSDQIEAVRLSGNRVRIMWSGDPRPVAGMQFSLLNSKRAELRNAMVTSLPAEAVFTRPSTAAYYRVVITYGDGAVRSIIAPL